ncbi:MAG: 2Fe-2S iron-sulfur cluster-binding protein [Woeseiaceae bacterium]|jgi:ferredoxin|nr:2Fe-2S iron-sulfur cluster-binding protein [Woeseiaceae bacterium]
MSNDTNISLNGLAQSSKDKSVDKEHIQENSLSDAPLVTFASSGIQVPWLGNYGSLLELAEASGLFPDFSCRAGICSTCECSIDGGDVNYLDEPLCEPEPGRVLICCSIPDGDVTLDL